ncbi:ABC transporter permease [soil metagenome]
MGMLVSRLRSLWRGLRRRSELEAGMEEEFRLHRELRTEDLIRSGMAPREAARRARLEFGSADRYREEGSAARGLGVYDELRRDLRHAARSLGRSPGFTLVAVLMLALGVGANAAVFSLVNAQLFRPLPFPAPDRLVVLHQNYVGPGRQSAALRWSYAEYSAVRSVVSTLSSVAAYAAAPVNLSGGGEAIRTAAEVVSASYFRTLGLVPVHGRDFVFDDDALSVEPVAIVGHDLWLRHFSGATDLSSQRLLVNGVALNIVGVAPPGFRGLTGEAEVWVTHAAGPDVYYSGYLTTDQQFISVVGRMPPGGSLESVRAEVATAGVRAVAAARGAAGADAPGEEWTADVMPLDAARRHPATVRAQLVLAGAVLFVLLIAVVNLFALLLARATARARETAVRAALGAGRLRLVRQGAVEGGLLGLMGGVLGVLFAVWSVRLLATLAPDRMGGPGRGLADVASFAVPSVDWRVVVFAAVLSLSAGLMAGILPAWRTTRGELTRPLRTGARGSTVGVGSVRRPTVLSAAAVVQVACALVLLTGAGALLKGFQQLNAIDPGFDAAGVVTFRITPPDRDYGGDAASPLLERIIQRIEAVPGVVSATVSLCAPLSQCSTTWLNIVGRPVSDEPLPLVGRHYVGPDHFRTLGIPLLRGRLLSDEDREGRPRVAVINETAARRFWPDQDPIGQRVWFTSGGGFASPDSPTEIVGIVGDVLYGSPGTDVQPDFYTSYLQFTWAYTTVMVRASGDPVALVPALRRAVLEVDANLPIHDVRTMAERSGEAMAAERFATLTLGVFAGLGLLLASLGVYGIMAYSVAQRRREIGIRLALGSTPRQVLRVMVAQGAALTLTGLGVGTVIALWLGRALPALIAGVASTDLMVFGVVVTLLALVSLIACYLPARSAMRVDPVETLAAD